MKRDGKNLAKVGRREQGRKKGKRGLRGCFFEMGQPPRIAWTDD